MSVGQNPAVPSLRSYIAEIVEPIRRKRNALWFVGFFLLLLTIVVGFSFLIESEWALAIMTFVLGYASVIAALYSGAQLVRKADYARVFAWRFKPRRLGASIVLNALGLLMVLLASGQLQIVKQGTQTAGAFGGLGILLIIIGFFLGSVSWIGQDTRAENPQEKE